MKLLAFIAINLCFWAACYKSPAAGSMVALRQYAPGVVLDIRYATANNFTHHAVYDAATCFLRLETAEKLGAVENDLRVAGLGLKVFDCYRPLSVQKKFWALVPDDRYVANPVNGSRHNRGAAVDLTLIRLADGAELPMGTGFDDFTERAHRNTTTVSKEAQVNRKLLEDAMTRHGFIGLPTEWWHFDDSDWQRYPIADISIRDLH